MFINTEIVRPDEKEGCCVVLLSARFLETGDNRRVNVLNKLMCPLKHGRDNLKINNADYKIYNWMTICLILCLDGVSTVILCVYFWICLCCKNVLISWF